MAQHWDYGRVVGHRGACGHAPENTIASLRAAQQLGVQWVEFDVQVAACGTPFIFHDQRLERMTSGCGVAADWHYAQLSKVRVRNPVNEAPEISDGIPTLLQWVEAAHELKLHLHLEIKCFDETPIQRWAEAIVHTLQTFNPPQSQQAAWGPALTQRRVYSSFSVPMLRALRALDPRCSLSVLYSDWSDEWRAVHRELNLTAVHLQQKAVTARRVQAVHEAGLQLLSYTVNEASIAKRLWGWGVEAVFSDHPDKLLAI